MANSSRIAVTSTVVLLLSACSWFDHSDASKPPSGGVDRRYAKTPDEVASAASETLRDLEVQVHSDTHDSLGGRITGERATAGKEEISIWFKSLDERTTLVSVLVGKGDRQLGELIQDRLAVKLGAAGASGVVSVGAITEGTYEQPLAQCISVAEATLKDLHKGVTRREVHDTWAELESRETDSVPLQIQMSRTEKDKTRVRFIAGVSKSQDTTQLANRLRAEFEKKIGPQSQAH